MAALLYHLALGAAERHSASRCAIAAPLLMRTRPMRQLLLIVGLLALAIGLLWIGQGTGVVKWPASSFMISQLRWAGYGAALGGLGLILIWQSKR
jgi:uncharacterized membrane protein